MSCFERKLSLHGESLLFRVKHFIKEKEEEEATFDDDDDDDDREKKRAARYIFYDKATTTTTTARHIFVSEVQLNQSSWDCDGGKRSGPLRLFSCLSCA